MHIPDYDRAHALALLKEKSGAPLSAFDVASRAHRRWDTAQHQDAANLFCLACERAQQEAATPKQSPNQAPNYFVRAAINFNLAGDKVEAEPMLRQATHIDWEALGLPHDSHMCEWAYVQLLLNCQTGPAPDFSDLYAQAVARCHELGRDFPSIHPQQEALLQIAMTLQLPHIAQPLADRISTRRPVSRATRAQLKLVQQWLENRHPEI